MVYNHYGPYGQYPYACIVRTIISTMIILAEYRSDVIQIIRLEWFPSCYRNTLNKIGKAFRWSNTGTNHTTACTRHKPGNAIFFCTVRRDFGRSDSKRYDLTPERTSSILIVAYLERSSNFILQRMRLVKNDSRKILNTYKYLGAGK